MYLFIDTETTGLPPRGVKVTESNYESWAVCRVVQVAWEVRDAKGTILSMFNSIVKPQGFLIPNEVVRIHGISNEIANTTGKPIEDVLQSLMTVIGRYKVTTVVAHNIVFDDNALTAEMYRAGMKDDVINWRGLHRFCTMKSATRPGERWPKLAVLYERLCGPLTEAVGSGRLHDASVDVRLCAEVYFKLAPPSSF